MNRRQFLFVGAAGTLSLAFPYTSRGAEHDRGANESFDTLSRNLLRDWCDGMLAHRIVDPGNAKRHGALDCPACTSIHGRDFIHGRCFDAVYPFLHQAKVTGDEKYLTAGIEVFEWSKNVTLESGAWTNDLSPKSWKGPTLFAAIGLADTLKYHGDLLDEKTRSRWMERLGKAGDFIHQWMVQFDVANINYGLSSIYGFHLLGKMLHRPEYLERSRQFAGDLDNWITKSGLLHGEGRPHGRVGPRGCRSVDIGYNVEETIPNILMAAIVTGDNKLMATAKRLLNTHLAFMLPDGAWDNSFGSRQAKWTYWGSRTTDGCQAGYALLAGFNPAFATAVIENTRLKRRCTVDGLLAGGPHLVSAGMKPCIHHTFTHAKSLALLRDHQGLAQKIKATAPLPRAEADGVNFYPEMATWLAARGPWRATVCALDLAYNKDTFPPTGGCISMLWHPKLGPLFASSMPHYFPVEPFNMQRHPQREDNPLTPRIELHQGGKWFTQLYDFTAQVKVNDAGGLIKFDVTTRLVDKAFQAPTQGQAECELTYQFDSDSTTISARAPGVGTDAARPRLMLPVISPAGEKVVRVSAEKLEIRKPGGTLILESNAPLEIQDSKRSRIFNLVPGFEAIPIFAVIPKQGTLTCRIRMRA
ncbi:MAG: hypothetical protein FJ395_18020 [Verrucomicrobia bacterium]|nr:hypothetical protein [Verrucomicrobiota bacterium]